MATLPKLEVYTGTATNVTWGTGSNWSAGYVPGAANTALFLHSANLSGPVEVGTLMLIGAETVSINGAIKTDSTNTCESFMICQDAAVTFNAGSSLTDAGGMEVGVHGVGSVTVAAGTSTAAAANLNMEDLKVGQFTGAVGTLTLAGGNLTAVGPTLIGVLGQGTMNVGGSATESSNQLALGVNAGGSGTLNMSGNASVTAKMLLSVGSAVQGGVGGTGDVTLGGHATLNAGAFASVGAGSAIAMAGGTLNIGSRGTGLTINQGGTVSGYGAVNSSVQSVVVNGTLGSAGGTLVVTGNVSGMGTLSIGTGSTLDLVASRVSTPNISFLGSTGTLELATEVHGVTTIGGFQGGDQLLMAGIDHASWNGSTDVLTLSEHGQMMDQFTLTGVAAGASFSVTPGIGGSVIALTPAHH